MPSDNTDSTNTDRPRHQNATSPEHTEAPRGGRVTSDHHPWPGVSSTIWVPPAHAAGTGWRAWVQAAITAAFLPPAGRQVELTGALADHSRGPSDVAAEVAGGFDRSGADQEGVTPFWAHLVTGATPAVSVDAPPATRAQRAEHERADLAVADLDGVYADDRLGMYASGMLRVGGILAVLTRCRHLPSPHPGGHAAARLVDPTGSVVASAQNADLLYLQHIVIPTHPLTPAPRPNQRLHTPPEPHHATAHGHGRSPRQRRHPVTHADLLIFGRQGRGHTIPSGPSRSPDGEPVRPPTAASRPSPPSEDQRSTVPVPGGLR